MSDTLSAVQTDDPILLLCFAKMPAGSEMCRIHRLCCRFWQLFSSLSGKR